MDNTIFQDIKAQSQKLPQEVRTFIASSGWDKTIEEILTKFNLSEETQGIFRNEVLLVIVGIVHPDEFRGELADQLGAYDENTDSIASEIDEKIFAPIRPALIAFFESEQSKEGGEEEKAVSAPSEALLAPPAPVIQPAPPAPPRVWEKTPDIAPDNLPTEETTESFLPNLTPKTVSQTPSDGVHPFEQKMKQVFTGSIPANGDLVLETPSPSPTQTLPEQKLVAQAPRPADPYREPIE